MSISPVNWLPISCLLITIFGSVSPSAKRLTEPGPHQISVPIGGNSWVVNGSKKPAKISKEGLSNWSTPLSAIDTYVRFEQLGTLTVSINLRVPSGKSRIRVTVLGKSNKIDVQGDTLISYPLGQWTIANQGYVKISLQGVTKTGKVYAEVTNFDLSGEPVDDRTAFVRTNDGNFFYWGRRGPSVHLNYPIPAGVEAEWFYNEVTVPTGNDVIGSYYMATGFSEGYFGMQVNSATERRILFSVWSPFQTDDPKQIPDNQKVRLAGKGKGVIINDFGNEGAGGQSFLRYRWQAGQTYRFLLHAQPEAGGYTTYTAYFSESGAPVWQLIASFKRPKTTTYLKSLHSFLENFEPETGNIQREVEFSNQWVCSRNGQWHELTDMRFTGDNTARKAYRMDYAGGLNHGRFFLRNCGFFNTYTPLNTRFTRPTSNQPPSIDFSTLPTGIW